MNSAQDFFQKYPELAVYLALGIGYAVGGGLLRDILVREEPLLFMPGQFYALIAIGGCALFIALLRSGWMAPDRAALLTIVIVFVVRMLAIRFNWRTTALYRWPLQPPS